MNRKKEDNRIMKKKVNGRTATITIALVALVGLVSIFAYSNSHQDAASPVVVQSDYFYEGQPSLGNQEAPVKIVEFGDFKCPHCKTWEDEVFPQLKEKYIDQGIVQFFFVNLAFIGPDSLYAAEVGEAVATQGYDLFFKYYDLVYKNQQDENTVWATEEYLFGLIEEHIPEVNLERLRSDLEEGKYKENVTNDIDFATDIGLNSVPAVFVNGQKVNNPFDFKSIEKLIDKAKKSAE